MSFASFLGKQFIDVIQWNEPEPGVLVWRYPMPDAEIQNGGQLTVRESEMAMFIDQGRIADVFGPGLYTLNTANLPILTDLKNWAKDFESPFKSDVYFFSTHLQIDQKWGTAPPRPSPSATPSSAPSGCALTASTPTASRIRERSSRRSAARARVTLPSSSKTSFETLSSRG
jgi:membrane protease subunit (stomatin/prohibitin family)